MKSQARIVITTRDSAGWLAQVLEWYQRLGQEPFFIVDGRTQDATREIIQRYGFSFKEFTPRGDFPEAGMLEFGAHQSDKDWILRLDDDELPNQRLLHWAQSRGVNSKNQCWFISRREIFLDNSHFVYSRSIGKYPITGVPHKLHPMARLYHRSRVKFAEALHTTGLEELKLYDFAPNDCFIVHFSVLIRSFSQRLSKLKEYEKLLPGSSWGLSDEYLPELFSPLVHHSSSDGLEEFRRFFEGLTKPQAIVSLSEIDESFLKDQVKVRARKILHEQLVWRLQRGSGHTHISADDVAWIDWVPWWMCIALVRLLGTAVGSYKPDMIDVLWNYTLLYKSRTESSE